LTRVRLPLPSDFSFDGVVRSHGWYDLPPFSYEREKGILKTVVDRNALTPSLSRGERGEAAEISFRVRGGRLEAESEALERGALSRIARRVFSLDVDLDAFARTIAGEPDLARALASGRGRILRAPTLFEDAVKMLLTTNCSWAATKGMVTRLIAVAGAGGLTFPTAVAVASFSAAKLKAKVRCGYRAESLARLSRRVARGELDLARWERGGVPAEDVRAAIQSEHGFGPYAAEWLLRILGRHDFLAIDSWVRQEYRRRYPGPRRTTDGAIGRRYARYGAHRGLALWLDMTSHWHDGSQAVDS
jgi:3-methyladenine DNA glycosylase/8-oxoguanine DNA glycosylase